MVGRRSEERCGGAVSKLDKIPKVPPAAIRAYGEMLEYRLMVVAAVAASVLSRSGPPAPVPVALASPTQDDVDAGRVIVHGAIALSFGLPWPPVAQPQEPVAEQPQEPVAEQPQVLAALNVTAAVGQAVTSK